MFLSIYLTYGIWIFPNMGRRTCQSRGYPGTDPKTTWFLINRNHIVEWVPSRVVHKLSAIMWFGHLTFGCHCFWDTSPGGHCRMVKCWSCTNNRFIIFTPSWPFLVSPFFFLRNWYGLTAQSFSNAVFVKPFTSFVVKYICSTLRQFELCLDPRSNPAFFCARERKPGSMTVMWGLPTGVPSFYMRGAYNFG